MSFSLKIGLFFFVFWCFYCLNFKIINILVLNVIMVKKSVIEIFKKGVFVWFWKVIVVFVVIVISSCVELYY